MQIHYLNSTNLLIHLDPNKPEFSKKNKILKNYGFIPVLAE